MISFFVITTETPSFDNCTIEAVDKDEGLYFILPHVGGEELFNELHNDINYVGPFCTPEFIELYPSLANKYCYPSGAATMDEEGNITEGSPDTTRPPRVPIMLSHGISAEDLAKIDYRG